MKKIDLIYILGFGHSGSTLLDLILGAQPNIESVGELIRLKKELGWEGTCTCNKKISECNYWQDILTSFRKKFEKDSDLSRINEDQLFDISSVLYTKEANRYFRKIFKGKNPLTNIKFKLIDHYARKYYHLYSAILEKTNSETIVDSSKNHRNLLFLSLSGYFDIKVIYLYRNGYELINSYRKRSKNLYKEVIDVYGEENLEDWYKQRIKAKFDRNVNIFDIVKYFSSFVISHKNKQNTLKYLTKYYYMDEGNLILLNYKSLSSNPSDVLKKTADLLEIDIDENTINIENPNYFLITMGHNLGGNILRTRGVKPIVYNSNWIHSSKLSDKWIFKLLGGVKTNNKFEDLDFGIHIL